MQPIDHMWVLILKIAVLLPVERVLSWKPIEAKRALIWQRWKHLRPGAQVAHNLKRGAVWLWLTDQIYNLPTILTRIVRSSLISKLNLLVRRRVAWDSINWLFSARTWCLWIKVQIAYWKYPKLQSQQHTFQIRSLRAQLFHIKVHKSLFRRKSVKHRVRSHSNRSRKLIQLTPSISRTQFWWRIP